MSLEGKVNGTWVWVVDSPSAGYQGVGDGSPNRYFVYSTLYLVTATIYGQESNDEIRVYNGGGGYKTIVINPVAYVNSDGSLFHGLNGIEIFSLGADKNSSTPDLTYKSALGFDLSLITSANYESKSVTAKGDNGPNKLIAAQITTTLIGNGGNDVLVDGSSNTSMYGGTENDTYEVRYASSRVFEAVNAGTDTVKSWLPAYTLSDNVENLTFMGNTANNGNGNALNNVLIGNTANDVLNGGAGNDTLQGSGGNDTLEGGLGQDLLTGGSGADMFRFASLSASHVGSTVRDIIADFSSSDGDKIGLGYIDANTAISGDQAFTFIGSNAFTGAGQVRYSGGVLQLNVDSNLAPDAEIQLTGAPPLGISAFVL